MNRIAVALVALALALPAYAQQPDAKKPPAAGKPAGSAQDTDRTLYSIGLAIAKSLEVFALSPGELDRVVQGIRDGATGKPKFELDDQAQQSVNEFARSRLAAAGEKEKAKGSAYLEKMAKEKGATKTESGAILIPTKPGTGPSPTAQDTVRVHYTGTLVDGKVFDSSVQRGEPAEFPLGGVIKCWTEALQKMKVGGKARVVCPSALAYGEQGRPPVIPGNAVLTFDVELLEIVKQGQGQKSPHGQQQKSPQGQQKPQGK